MSKVIVLHHPRKRVDAFLQPVGFIRPNQVDRYLIRRWTPRSCLKVKGGRA